VSAGHPGTGRLSGLAETAFVPLVARATAAERFPDIGFRDRTAEAICAALQLDLIAGGRRSHLSTLGVISRSWMLDQLIGVFTSHHPGAQIVNLGAGLSTTFERIDNGMMSWVDVDTAPVIALRQTLFPHTPRRRMVAVEIAAPGWVEHLGLAAAPTMIVAEGLLMYLEPDTVGAVLADLAAGVPGRPCELVFDYVHPVVVGRRGLHPMLRQRRAEAGAAPIAFRWGVRRRGLARPECGWQLLRARAVYDRIGFPYTLMSRLFQRLAGGHLHGIAHLARSAQPRRLTPAPAAGGGESAVPPFGDGAGPPTAARRPARGV